MQAATAHIRLTTDQKARGSNPLGRTDRHRRYSRKCIHCSPKQNFRDSLRLPHEAFPPVREVLLHDGLYPVQRLWVCGDGFLHVYERVEPLVVPGFTEPELVADGDDFVPSRECPVLILEGEYGVVLWGEHV